MRSPFKFLDSYNREDSSLFFGRDREIEELYTRVFQSKLLLVYGASGSGKTSLVNCGLANKFMDSDWLPIFIRKGDNILESMVSKIHEHTLTPIKKKASTKTGINRLLQSVFLDHFKPIYLIFDQFEELFLLGNRDEWITFIQLIEYLKDSELNLHFVFIVRGEYLEYLSEFEDSIPEFFDNRLRVEKMTRNNAIESIEGPAKLYGIEIEDGFSEELFKVLSPEKAEIELTYLQVFLDRVFHEANTNENDKLQFRKRYIEKLGEIGDVLDDFIDGQIFSMDHPIDVLSVLKTFVSLQGTKAQLSIDEVVQKVRSLGANLTSTEVKEIILELVNRRILRDKDTSGRYELRHDSLAKKVFDKITLDERARLDVIQFLNYALVEHQKRGSLLTEQDLIYISQHEKDLELDEPTDKLIQNSKIVAGRKKSTRRKWIILGIAMFALLVITGSGYWFSEKQKQAAEELAVLAKKESDQANLDREIAQSERKLAELKSQEALVRAKIAEEQRLNALLQKGEAENLRKLALEEKDDAISEKEIAIQAQFESDENAKRNAIAKERAEKAKEVALNRRLVELSRTLAIKSIQTDDAELKAILSKHAFNFYEESGQSGLQPELYQSLFESNGILHDPNHNLIHKSSSSIRNLKIQGNKLLAASADGKIYSYELDSLDKAPYVVEISSQINKVMDVHSDKILTGTDEGNILIASEVGDIYSVKAHKSDVNDLHLISLTKVITGGADGWVKLTSTNGDVLSSMYLESPIRSIVYENDSSILIGTDSGILYTTDITLSLKTEEFYFDYAITNMSDFGDGTNKIIVGLENGDLIIWSNEENQVIQRLKGHNAQISEIFYEENSNRIVSSSYDGTIRVWDAKNLRESPVIIYGNGSWVLSVVGSGDRLYGSNMEGEILVYELNMSTYAEKLCRKLTGNLSEEQWDLLVAEDLDIIPLCEK